MVEQNHIRNYSIVAHIDHGKSTLAGRFGRIFCLFYGREGYVIHKTMGATPFSTKILDDHLLLEKDKKEAKRLQKVNEVFSALEALAKQFSFHQAYLFGSLAKPGRFDPQSDFDIVIDGLASEDFIPALSFLSSHLGRDVDLIRLEGFLWKERIMKEGIPWKKHG